MGGGGRGRGGGEGGAEGAGGGGGGAVTAELRLQANPGALAVGEGGVVAEVSVGSFGGGPGEVVAEAGLAIHAISWEDAEGARAAERALDEGVVGEGGGVGAVLGVEVQTEGLAISVRAAASVWA